MPRQQTVKPQQVFEIAMRFIDEHRRTDPSIMELESMDIDLHPALNISHIQRTKTEHTGSVDELTSEQSAELYDALSDIIDLPDKHSVTRCEIFVQRDFIANIRISMIPFLKERVNEDAKAAESRA